MVFNLKDFTNAVSKIETATGEEKVKAHFMLVVKADSVDVCFANGKVGTIEKIPAKVEEGEVGKKIGLPLKRVCEVVSACQPTGSIVVNNLELKMGPDTTENKTIIFRAEKKLKVAGASGGSSDEEEAYTEGGSPEDAEVETEDNGELKTVSVFEQPIMWKDPDNSKLFGLVNRYDYASIFTAGDKDPVTNEKIVDVWDVQELRDIITKTMPETGRLVYFSPKVECAFSANASYLVRSDLGEHESKISLSAPMAKMVIDIVGKLRGNTKEVSISFIDQKNCFIYTEDGTFGLWFVMGAVNPSHVSTFQQFMARKYESYQMTLYREVILNVVRAAQMTEGVDKTDITFSFNEDGTLNLNMDITNTAASVHNKYSVECEDYIDTLNNLGSAKFSMSLKNLEKLVGNCGDIFVAIDVDVMDGGTTMRVADIDYENGLAISGEVINKYNADMAAQAEPGVEVEEVNSSTQLPVGLRLELRGKTLGIAHYAMLDIK